jgi:hypothetical protein
MTTTESFTATGNGSEHAVRRGETLSWDVSGTFVGTVVLEQYVRNNWSPIASAAAPASGTVLADCNERMARYRFTCSEFTSGTIVAEIADVTTIAFAERRAPDGTLLERSTRSGLELVSPRLATPQGPVHAVVVDFVETAGAGTYTGAIAIPAGATLLDVIVHASAVWDPVTSAVLDVGDDDDPDGIYAAVDLMATDLAAGQSLSFAQAGGKAGAYNVGTNSHWTNRYKATARTLSAVVVVVGASGTTGRTRMTVVYQLPPEADVITATKA